MQEAAADSILEALAGECGDDEPANESIPDTELSNGTENDCTPVADDKPIHFKIGSTSDSGAEPEMGDDLESVKKTIETPAQKMIESDDSKIETQELNPAATDMEPEETIAPSSGLAKQEEESKSASDVATSDDDAIIELTTNDSVEEVKSEQEIESEQEVPAAESTSNSMQCKSDIDSNSNSIDNLAELNCNNNNNLDGLTTPSDPDSFAGHLLAMAGGDNFLPPGAEPVTPTSSTRQTGLNRCDSRASARQLVTCHVTVLPKYHMIESVKEHIERLVREERKFEEFEMDVLYIVLQIINTVLALNERQVTPDSINATDFLVTTDVDGLSSVQYNMINVKHVTNSSKQALTCQKLRIFFIQISHICPQLAKGQFFVTMDDMVQNAGDLGDLKTIAAILRYILWGPKEDEVKIITLSENRRQAFELWLQLARGKLINRLTFSQMDRLKIFHIAQFFSNTSGSELFKITKLLNTY